MEEKKGWLEIKPMFAEEDTDKERHLSIMDWMYLFTLHSIPVVGLIALIIVSVRRPRTEKEIEQQMYARAKLIHKAIIYGIIFVITIITYIVIKPYAIDFLDKLEAL